MHHWTVLQSSESFSFPQRRSLRLQVTLVAARRWNSLEQTTCCTEGKKKNTEGKRNAQEPLSPTQCQKKKKKWLTSDPEVCTHIRSEAVYLVQK